MFKEPGRQPLFAPATPLVGREAELSRLAALLGSPEVRLLTLTGPGGVGKTRLALAAAEAAGRDHPDGVVVVNLAPVSSEARVAEEITRALALELGARDPLDALKAHLRDSQLLLVLDNFEHLLGASDVVAGLLAARGVSVLATSRAPLRLRGEREFPVPPLPLPRHDPRGAPAVQLFAQRAAQARPDFALDEENAEVVAEIVRRLDGLPLAIELAAGRSRLLPPRAILARLDSRLRLLTDGARDLPVRQRTLRATLDWSYALLEDAERALFARLGVFVGGWTLEAASAVSGADALPGLGVLVENSLVRQSDAGGDPRFAMLETLREYALEKLEARGGLREARERHARHHLALAEASVPGQRGPDQGRWFARLADEQPNFLAALRFCLDEGRAEMAAAFFRALAFSWLVRVDYSASALLNEALASERFTGRPRAAALIAKVMLDFRRGALRERDCEEALALLGPDEDTPDVASVLFYRGLARAAGNARAAVADLERAAGIAEGFKDAWGVGNARQLAAWLLAALGDLDESERLCLNVAGLAGAAGDTTLLAWNAVCRGGLALRRGRPEAARGPLGEALETGRRHRDVTLVTGALEGFAALAAGEGRDARAALLYGSVSALRRGAGLAGTVESAVFAPLVEPALLRLGEAEREAQARRGENLGVEDAVAYALARDDLPRGSPAAAHDALTRLTAREMEVLRALAQGLSNKEIARALGISLYTVGDHVKTIFSKLGVGNRAAATRRALEHLTP